MATYTVKSGDCLWTIAKNQLGNAERWPEIATLNNISSPYTIYVGNVLQLPSGSGSGSSSSSSSSSNSNMATISFFGLQAGTDKTVFAAWTWSKSNTDNYRVIWRYDTGDRYDNGNSVWYDGQDTTVTSKQSIYTAPSNAKRVAFKVKPISKKYKASNGKETSYWTADWTSWKYYNFSNNPPVTPSVPTVTITNLQLTAKIENINMTDLHADSIEFYVVKDDSTKFSSGITKPVTNVVSYTCSVDAGCDYKVKCRSIKGSDKSAWSEYSSNSGTKPNAPSEITSISTVSDTSVYITWSTVSKATSYELEYADTLSYLGNSNASSTVSSITNAYYTLVGLESGKEYFFRVRAVNNNGNSEWTEAKSVIVGKKPIAPTTWSSTTTAMVGESLKLYWVHNSQDGSSQTYAELELTINGSTTTQTIQNSTDPDEKDKTSVYTINTSSYSEGTTILWRVRTRGVKNEYGDWSVQRTVNVYASPTLALSITNANGNEIETLTSFPFYISALAGPNTQSPIGYHVSVISTEIYETVDAVGNKQIINAGEEVYSKYFDVTTALLVQMSAHNINLENNITYNVKCTVTMNSGLTTSATESFTVAWTENTYMPNAEISYDSDLYVTYIRPYCVDSNDDPISGIYLSVYRREFDGNLIELATNIDNTKCTFITDPHPALDYARYRIVATTQSTGAVSYYDVPGYPIDENAVIIQWNEDWSTFDDNGEDVPDQPVWSGSLLRLPYNIDVSDNYNVDVSLISYVGRKRPVSYYGTQLGETSTWNVAIPKSDTETLYAIRRLATWQDIVYVREPSGSGYWASISVSFSQTHCELIIPITFNIVRVEGGA